jgi:hypothetical protein
MNDRFDLVKAWFQIADEDILAAEHELAYAVESRYPEPENLINLENAKEAVSIAKEVKNRIMKKVKF